MAISDELRQARERMKMTRKELARRVSRSPRTIKAWELGEYEPSEILRVKLEDALGVSLMGEADHTERKLDSVLGDFKRAVLELDADSLGKVEEVLEIVTDVIKGKRSK